MKWIHSLTTLPFLLTLTGCTSGPDMGPIGGGLAVIGLAIVIGAVVLRLPADRKGGDDDAAAS